ncbi:MAG TPA: protein translocase subunit SecD [Steroidobacteraceae bacterium]|nr:protein translocase subunit SecD [Steroidobacteraceae bacterium]
MLEYARWKYILICAVLAIALLLCMPTLFGQDEALQIATRDRTAIPSAVQADMEKYLREKAVTFTKTYLDNGVLMVRLPNVAEQLKARDSIEDKYSQGYVTALSFAPRMPEWMRKLGLRPIPLGLDLRGGLYLLYQVDVQGAVKQLLEGYEQDIRRALTTAKLPLNDVTTITDPQTAQTVGLRVSLPAGTDVDQVRAIVAKTVPDFTVSTVTLPSGQAVEGRLPQAKIRERQDYAIQQNLTTLRNRVNELGVAEPIVQRQGLDRINVQLPGVQNSAEVKDVLGKVAKLEFRLDDLNGNAYEVAQHGHAPIGTKLYYTKDGQPLLLRREVIATGDELTTANFTTTQDGPTVNVRLDQRAGDRMLKATQANLNHPMAVVYIESRRETVTVNGQKTTRDVTDQKVINNATIRGVFSNNFMITGMTAGEARDLALLLRSGSFAVPIYPVEEHAVGPSLGKENIEKGVDALEIGMAGVFLFMAIYYRIFGLVADVVLLANVVLLTALLSMLGAALSLPGIAGIILTVGMAVDANVLIYERIREELRNGVSPQASIRAGFEKAFSAIFDSNFTAFIAGVVLWILGSGPIRGFAVVLTLGIATSMFTSLMGSRALITLMYGGRRKPARLLI